MLRLEYAVQSIWKVYQIVPKSEVSCPKKDSKPASNWGRFLPALQIKLSLKLFVVRCILSHPSNRLKKKTPPSMTNTYGIQKIGLVLDVKHTESLKVQQRNKQQRMHYLNLFI